jgi:hypothetical protein
MHQEAVPVVGFIVDLVVGFLQDQRRIAESLETELVEVDAQRRGSSTPAAVKIPLKIDTNYGRPLQNVKARVIAYGLSGEKIKSRSRLFIVTLQGCQ